MYNLPVAAQRSWLDLKLYVCKKVCSLFGLAFCSRPHSYEATRKNRSREYSSDPLALKFICCLVGQAQCRQQVMVSDLTGPPPHVHVHVGMKSQTTTAKLFK